MVFFLYYFNKLFYNNKVTYINIIFSINGGNMKRVKTLVTRDLKESMKKGGCGECQTSCQSACKTSCTVGNQSCEQTQKELERN